MDLLLRGEHFEQAEPQATMEALSETGEPEATSDGDAAADFETQAEDQDAHEDVQEQDDQPEQEADEVHDEDAVEPPSREPEPALSIAASSEKPVEPAARPEIRVESESGEERAPRRKGWWSRG